MSWRRSREIARVQVAGAAASPAARFAAFGPPVLVRWRFAGFEFDGGRRQLLRDGSPIPIEPKPRELLAVLLERHPVAVSRSEIHERLWPDVFVTPASLNRAVNALRAVLSLAGGSGEIVRTIRGFGYGIAVDVEGELPLRNQTVRFVLPGAL